MPKDLYRLVIMSYGLMEVLTTFNDEQKELRDKCFKDTMETVQMTLRDLMNLSDLQHLQLLYVEPDEPLLETYPQNTI